MKQNYLSHSIVPRQKDVFGKAALDFIEQGKAPKIKVYAEHFDTDFIPVDYLFRDYKEMPPLEQKALNCVKGKVLDVGAGVGSHSLYIQNTLQLEVTAIDYSYGAIQVAQQRGLNHAIATNFYNFSPDLKYDTLLMLMNGIGIAGKLSFLPLFFQHARNLLTPNGKVILDSSDLIYLYDSEELSHLNHYYGEMSYQIGYKDLISDSFDWLYIGFEELQQQAQRNHFSCRLLASGEHYDYLAELQPI